MCSTWTPRSRHRDGLRGFGTELNLLKRVPPGTTPLNEYLSLYAAIAPPMKAQAATDGSTIHVGGPGSAGLDPSWVTAMLNDPVISKNIDFMSYLPVPLRRIADRRSMGCLRWLSIRLPEDPECPDRPGHHLRICGVAGWCGNAAPGSQSSDLRERVQPQLGLR